MPSHIIILLNKPYRVLSQFTDKAKPSRQTLAKYVSDRTVYPAGRLDYDSEGLLLLTNSGELQSRVSEPRHKLAKRYWVQVEGSISSEHLRLLQEGVELKDGKTLPAVANIIEQPQDLWPRNPPVTVHRAAKSSWLDIQINEGKNRQVRRMCAAVGLPVLRLVRHSIGHWSIGDLRPGEHSAQTIHLPVNGRATRGKSGKRKK